MIFLEWAGRSLNTQGIGRPWLFFRGRTDLLFSLDDRREYKPRLTPPLSDNTR